eukprot:Phypoly_transcript_16127.p1 GENE.Phypoly_transcript_16127~~Phypoly_transcript_16127.p1  ORF type:complete len:240 (+),score=13.95 Phypoly_transcript_16127:55-720(+)
MSSPVLLIRGTRWEASTCFDNPVVIHEHFVHENSINEHEEKTGLRVWDSSIALSKYLEKVERESVGTFRDKRVIELGSGCGLVGIIAARLGANVTLTDVGGLVTQLAHNINANHLGGNAKARELFWGTDVTEFLPPFDYILASDVTWVTHLVEPLVKTMSDLSSDKTQILMSLEHRSKITEDLLFEMLLKYKFSYKIIPHEEHDHHFSDPAIDIYLITKVP